jgi:uncharacterized SAM-binding protein YcdF (DUF218 family)
MLINLIQLLLLGLLIYIVWNSLQEGDKKLKPRPYLAWFGLFLILIFLFWAFSSPNTSAAIDFGNLITFPLKPLGLGLFLLFLAISGGIKGGGITKEAAAYVRAAFGVLVFFSIPLIASWLAQQGEIEALNAAQIAAQRQEPVSAIVLLGQGTTQLNLLDPNQIQLTDTSDRILVTAREYRRQRAIGSNPVVIVSAGNRGGYYDSVSSADWFMPSAIASSNSDGSRKDHLAEARDIARILVQMGVPQENILLNPSGVDFRSSALAVDKFIDEGRIQKRVILVAPALGMQRARQTFAQLGIETLPSPAGFLSFQSGAVPTILVDVLPSKACKNAVNVTIRNLRPLRLSDFISNADALLISNRVVNEFWSSVYYLLRGWLAPSGAEPKLQRAKDVPC